MAKFNVGDKVRILDVDSILFGNKVFNNGDINKVVSVDSDGFIYVANTDGRVLIITRDEFHAIEKVSEQVRIVSDTEAQY